MAPWRPLLLALLWLVTAGVYTHAHAHAHALELDAQRLQGPVAVAPGLSWFADRAGAYTLRDLQRDAAAVPWRDAAALDTLPRYDTALYWFRLPLVNAGAGIQRLLLVYAHPRQDILNVYITQEGQVLRRFETGSLRPFDTRPLAHHHFLFPFDLEPGQRVEVLIQVQSRPAYVPAVTTVWERDAFLAQQPRAEIWQWFFLGMLSAIALYHLVVFGLTRDWSYLLYTLYIGANLWLFLASYGQGFRYLWPQSPHLDQMMTHLIASVIGICISLFTVSFLNLREKLPLMARVFVAISLIWAGLLALRLLLEGPAGFFIQIVEIQFRVALLLSWLTSLYLWWRDRDRNARNYSIAWASFLLVTPLMLLGQPEPAPTERDFGYQIGLLVHIILFAVALASRINMLTLERQRVEAERHALAAVLGRISAVVRTPLQAILGMSALLRDGASGPQRERRVIEHAARRLLARTDDLIDSASLEAGQLSLEQQPFDLDGLLERVVPDAMPRAGVPRCSALREPTAPRRVSGDAARLQRLLGHLLEALQALEPEAVQIEALPAAPGRWRFLVRAEGLPAALEWSHPAQAGSDLAVVDRLARHAGGRLGSMEADAEAAGGLWLEWPLWDEAEAVPEAVAEPVSLRVLLLVRQGLYRRAAARVLAAAGIEVCAVASAAEALRRIEESQRGDARFDWVLGDAELPEGGVMELLRWVRERWPATALRGLLLADTGVEPMVSDRRHPAPRVLNRLPGLLRQASLDAPWPRPGGPALLRRVWVAEADADNRATWAALLGECGVQPELFESGRDLLHRYRRERRRGLPGPELVLADMRLEEPDVPALAHTLRDFECRHQLAPTRLVALASVPGAAVREEARQAGCDDVLLKPVALEALLEQLGQPPGPGAPRST